MSECFGIMFIPSSASIVFWVINYLNDRERERHYLLYDFDFGAPPPMPPSPDVTILNYLNDKEMGRHYRLSDFGAPPLFQRHNT